MPEGPFNNISRSYYSGVENGNIAWGFSFTYENDSGAQSYDIKRDLGGYIWVVAPGQLPAVLAPDAVWLFGTGLAGLLGLKRRGGITFKSYS